jgi:phage-related protein
LTKAKIDKPIYWIGTSKKDICDFPEEARRKAGFQLRAIQKGEKPSDYKPIPTIGRGRKRLESGLRRLTEFFM